MRRAPVSLAALLVLLPATSWAAQEGGEGTGALIWHLVNLVLLIVLLVRFAGDPVRSFFAERRRSIEAELGGAREQLREAEANLEGWQARLAELDREVEEVRARVRDQAEAEAERILAQARATADRIRRDAAAAVEHEARRARETLRAEVGSLAAEVAGRLLRENFRETDQGRLVDEFVQRVEQAPRRDGVEAGG